MLPEPFLTGYELDAIAANTDKHTILRDDSRLEPPAGACARTGVAAIVGAPTLDMATKDLHISSIVIARDGHLAGTYDKVHVDPEERSAGVIAGTGVAPWSLTSGNCRSASART